MPFITLDSGARLFLKRHSERTARHAIALYRSGHSPKMVWEETGVPVSTIEKWAARSGYGRGWSEARALFMARSTGRDWKELRSRAVYLYSERRVSTHVVADLLDVSVTTVYEWVKAAGVLRRRKEAQIVRFRDRRRAVGRTRLARILRVAQMRRDRMLLREIAAAEGFCVDTVRKDLASEDNPYRETLPNSRRFLLRRKRRFT